MSMYVFVGFEGNAAAIGNPTTWADWRKPVGVTHNKGAATQDTTIAPPNSASWGTSIFGTGRPVTGASGKCMGGGTVFSGASSPTYSAYHTAQGYQVSVSRASWSIGDEVYCSMEIQWYTLPTSSMSGLQPTAGYNAIWRWGDLSLVHKSSTYDSGTGHHAMVYAMMNAGVEVATITVPGTQASTWHHVRIRAKLHATTGLIEASIDGHAQSAAYTNQNTIAVTSLVSAAHIHFGPPVADDNASTCRVGYVDDIWLGDAYPTGRPVGTLVTLSADGTLSGWAAEGTSATTVVNALSSDSDAKAARGSGVGSSALLTLAALSIPSLTNTIHGFQMFVVKVSNRDLVAAKRLAVGVSLSGVHTMGSLLNATNPPADSVTTPPAVNYIHGHDYVWNPSMGVSDWTNIRVRLLVEAAG